MARVGANRPAGCYKASGVSSLVGMQVHSVRCDSGGAVAGGFGALGGLLGQVGRYRVVGDLARCAHAQVAYVELVAPGDAPALGRGRVWFGGEGGGGGRADDDVLQDGAGQAGRGRDNRVLVERVQPVEAEQRVKVDHAASLELGDLGVGQPQRCAVGPGEPVELAAGGNDGAAPQLADLVVPDDVCVVVVAVQAERLAE